MQLNHKGTGEIETARLWLRPFTADDSQDMFDGWASDPEVTRYLTWPTHQSVDNTRNWLTFCAGEYADAKYYNWCLVLKETARVIGTISVVHMKEEIAEAELGWALSRAQWGKGFMPEAARAVIDYLIDDVGFNRVCARHDTRNAKSGRVMTKCGMRYEGTSRQSDRNNEGLCDTALYAICRCDARRKDSL